MVSNNKVKKSIVLIMIMTVMLLVGGFKSTAKAKVNFDKTTDLTVKQWIDDINYLYENLPKYHKNLYHSMKEETFKGELEKLKKDVPQLKDYEIRCRLAQIVALVGDAHTSVWLDFSQNGNKTYPISLEWFGNELRVILTEKDKKEILGLRIKEINNVTVEEVMKRVNSLISHENSQWVKAVNVDYVVIPEVLKLLNIISEDKVVFTFEDEGGNIKKIELMPSIYNEDNIVKIKDEIVNKPLRMQGKDTLQDKLYWYRYIPEEKILYLQYNSCIDYYVAKMYGIKDYDIYPKFDEFSKGFLKELQDNKVDKLIVDLRNNGGGNSLLMTELVSAMEKTNKLNDEGKTIVLIGKKTFSSAVMNTLDFKDKLNAVLIGEPTGGNANSYGEVRSLVLPNSKVMVGYSTKYFNITEMYKDNIIPDVMVDETFNKYKNGIDEVYETAKNYKIKN